MSNHLDDQMRLKLNRASRGTIISFIILIGLVMPAVSLGVWWAWLDPIAPKIVNEGGRITDLTPNVGPGQRGVFEVTRIITSDRDAPCTIYSFFQRPNVDMSDQSGRPVISDPTTFAIANAPTRVEKGRHKRDRLWEVPGNLPAGTYLYRSFMRFCNPLRCADVWFDPLEVRFRMGGPPAP